MLIQTGGFLRLKDEKNIQNVSVLLETLLYQGKETSNIAHGSFLIIQI